MAEENNGNYVVLARKYRPQSFNELLGQDALVRTITNAIKNNPIVFLNAPTNIIPPIWTLSNN